MSFTYPTLADLVEATILRVGQVNGIGAQVYSEDVIAEMVKHKFDVLFDKFNFPEYDSRYDVVLGSDGKATADLQVESIGINRFKDIRGVWYESDSRPLQMFPSQRMNVSLLETSGAHPIMIESTGDNRVFRVLPFGSSGGVVHVHYKHYPETIIADTQIKVDRQALILGAAYDYLADDNANPSGIEKMRNLFNQRIQQLMADESIMDRFDVRAGRSSDRYAGGGYMDVG